LQSVTPTCRAHNTNTADLCGKKTKKNIKIKQVQLCFQKQPHLFSAEMISGTEMRTGAYNYFSSTKTQKNQPEKNL